MKNNIYLNIKYKNHIIFISSAILLFCAANFPAKSCKYVFTADIYDQEDALAQIRQQESPILIFSEEEKDALMEAELAFRKHQEVKKNYLTTIQRKVEFLEGKFNTALREENKRNFIERLGGLFDSAPAVGYLIAGTGNIAGPLFGNGVQVAARLVTHAARTTFTSSDADAHAQPSAIVSEMHKLGLEAIDFVEGLSNEPGGSLASLEKAYARKKRRIKDPALRRQIEEDFLSARQNIQFGMSAAQFIEDALRLPLEHKRIDESSESIEERFNRDPDFRSYDAGTKRMLKNILLEIADDSRQPDDTCVSLRRIYCFYGIASGGKTTATKKIPEFFGFPYIEKSISDFKDVSEVSLEGSRAPFNVNMGWFIRPFLEHSQEDGRSYSNAFLIINDSDNILSPNNPAAKAFYANYLDPNNRSIINRYFKINYFINRLTIIITTNTDIEKMQANLPLMSRLTFVPFPRLKESDIKPKMDKTLESLRQWKGLPDFMTLSYLDSTRIKIDYRCEQLAQYGIFESLPSRIIPICLPQGITAENITPRDLEHKYFKTTITEFSNEGRELYNQCLILFEEGRIREGQSYFWEAALRGHLKALTFLKDFRKIPEWLDLGRLLKSSYPDRADEWYRHAVQIAQEYRPFLEESKARFLHNPEDTLVEKLLKFLPHPIKISYGQNGAWTTPFHIAAKDNNERLLNALLKGQNQTNVNMRLTGVDSFGCTPFHSAAYNGRKEILAALLQKYPNGINQEGTNKLTPIIYAIDQGHLDVVKLLHARGAKMTLNHVNLRSVLQYALMQRNQNPQANKFNQIVDFLLEKSPCVVDYTGQMTPFFPSINYKIINQWTIYNRALSVTSNDILAVNNDDNANDKLFRFIPSSTQGYYFIENVGTKKLINIRDEDTVTAQETNYTNADSNQWLLFQLVPKRRDGYYIQNQASGKVLCTSFTPIHSITAESDSEWFYQCKLFQIQKVN